MNTYREPCKNCPVARLLVVMNSKGYFQFQGTYDLLCTVLKQGSVGQIAYAAKPFSEEAMMRDMNNKKGSAMKSLEKGMLSRGNKQRPDYIGFLRRWS